MISNNFFINSRCLKKLPTVFFSVMLGCSSYAQPSSITNNYHSNSGLRQLQIERSFIYVPAKEWMYSHHPHISFFKNQLVAIWSNGMKDEDAPGQRKHVPLLFDYVVLGNCEEPASQVRHIGGFARRQ